MAHGVDGLSRRRILLNSDPEPTETLLGMEALVLGIVYLLGTFIQGICKAPVAVGLISTVGDDGLHLVGTALIVVAFVQWGAVYHDTLWTRRCLLIGEIGWWVFVAATYGGVMGFTLGPLLFAVFALKAAWALWRLFQHGVHQARPS